MNDRGSAERGSGISVLVARHDDDDEDINLAKIFVLKLFKMVVN